MKSDVVKHNILKLRSHCAKFSHDTTFHGFSELHKSKRWYQKCLWIFIMVGCTALLCYQINEQLRQYTDYEVVTKTIRLAENDMYDFPKPILMLHSPTWIDVSKAWQYGLTYEDVQTAAAYLRPAHKNRPVKYESQISVEDAKISLKSKMDMLGMKGIYHLFSSIAWRQFINEEMGEFAIDFVTFSRDWSVYNLKVAYPKLQAYGNTWKSEYLFNFDAYWKNGNKSAEFFKAENKTNTVQPFMFNPNTDQKVLLFPNQEYMISVDCSLYRRLHACRNTSHPAYYPALCKEDCQFQANLPKYSCFRANESDHVVFELSESFRNGSIPLCHLGVSINGTVHGADIRQVRNTTDLQERQRLMKAADCSRRCMPKCDSYSNSWSTLSIPYSYDNADEQPSNTARVIMNYPGGESMVITVEVERYKWHDIVSNIGGLLGLWLGASIMSIFQAVHLCCWEENEH